MKAYCTQNNGECETCSLSNYGRDCRNNPISTKNKFLNVRVSEDTLTKLKELAAADNRSQGNWIETIVNERYEKLKEETKMKKATLKHDDQEGFCIVGEDGFISYKIDTGTNPDEPDWDLIERQANKMGYTLD